MTRPSHAPRVLLLAADCNPEWPSLPVVGYKYARAIAEHCETTVVTHIRNRENIEKLPAGSVTYDYIDNEHIAGPMYKLAKILRGGDQVAWSTNMMMAYPPYIAFERIAWKRWRDALKRGQFDIVHRITPMSPTLPSYMAGRAAQPFLIGPLNGNLAWPEAYRAEMSREREGLRRFRDLYKLLPYSGSTYRNATAVLAAFQHTIDDLSRVDPGKLVMFPEIGFDETLFHSDRPEAPPDGPLSFLFAGRLVPYKAPEVAVRAFAQSTVLRAHTLHVVGDGPERGRLQQIVDEHGLQDCVRFEGSVPQSEVAAWMRRCDVFVFPSIRELGAGVVVEAMASEMLCLVVDYGAPGDLVSEARGMKAPLQPLEPMVNAFQAAMERCVADRAMLRSRAAAARQYADSHYRWSVKGALTAQLYDWALGAPPRPPAPQIYADTPHDA